MSKLIRNYIYIPVLTMTSLIVSGDVSFGSEIKKMSSCETYFIFFCTHIFPPEVITDPFICCLHRS